MNELATRPHTHIRTIMYRGNTRQIAYEHKWIDREDRTPEHFVADLIGDLKQHFEIHAVNSTMGFDHEGKTQYNRMFFKFNDTEDRLTVHVFTCYCSDFVEGDKPPF